MLCRVIYVLAVLVTFRPVDGTEYECKFLSGGVDYTQFNPVGDGTLTTSQISGFKFQAKGNNDAHVLLQQSLDDYTDNIVEIVLGGWGNGQSVIRNRQQGSHLASYSGAVLSASYNWFWVTWSDGCVKVGTGKTMGSSEIMSWCSLSHGVSGVRISYGYGSGGWFNIPTQPAPCSTPVDVSQATLSFSNTLHGSTSTYTCNAGYEITSGDASRMCSYGSWNGSQPTCGDIDECATNPCQNSGVCSNLLDAYSCACTSQWSGTNCDTLSVNCKRKYTTAIFCEHSKGHLQCPKGKQLNICDADYGRTVGSTICDNGNTEQTSNTNCTSNPQTFESVSATCNNQATCYLDAENSVYGDPCVGTWKYLEVKYRCVFKKWRG